MPQLRRKIRTGIVLSDKMDKTIVVRVTSRAMHPLYKKVVTKANKFKVHDEKNQAKVGDKVLFKKYGPDEIEVDKKKYLVGTEDDVLAIIE